MPLANFTNLDFNQVKTTLREYLKENSNFTDYDFEGSNLSTILDVLAYNTYITSYNANMVASEVFIDSATLRENVVSLAKNIGYLPKSRKVFLIDKPNAIQSYIVAGQLLPPTGSDDEILMEYMNYAIGGSFTSRLNMNLREDKSWSYGVRNRLADAKGQRSILVNAPVQTDKTADSIKEIIKEFDYYLGDQPIRYDELEKAKSSKTLRLPGRFETLGSLLGGMTNIVQYDRSLNYLDELSSLYSEPTLEEVQNTARKYLKPNQWSWLIVGDLKEIESEVRALNLGEVEIISN